jgi:hypothetical protein
MEGTQLKLNYEFNDFIKGDTGVDIEYKVIAYRDFFDGDDWDGSEIFVEEFTKRFLLAKGIKVSGLSGTIDDPEQVLLLLHHYFQKHLQFRENALEHIPEYASYDRKSKIRKALGK